MIANAERQGRLGQVDAEIRKKSKAEDILGYDLALLLRGERPQAWRRYVNEKTGEFLLDAKSDNHKAMAAALWLLETGSPKAVQYWTGRLRRELEGGEFEGKEPLSNKYSVWSLAPVALVWEWATVRRAKEDRARNSPLAGLARRYYRAWMALASLGGSIDPATSLVGRRWNGVTVAAVGVRSDPGHLVGDTRAYALEEELRPQRATVNAFLRNAAKRRQKALAQGPQDDFKAELNRRKTISELWPVDALTRARKAGLGLTGAERAACLAWLAGSNDAGPLREMLAGVGCLTTFHFTRYADETRVNWIESSNERTIFGERSRGGLVQVLFPFPSRGNERGGTAGPEGGRLVAHSSLEKVSLPLPAGSPVHHLVFGPGGLKG